MFLGKCLWLVLALLSGTAEAARIKDLASLKGVRNNQLTGYGIVVGLAGTGDSGFDLTASSLGQALKSLGIDQRNQKLESKNAAAVFVSAVLPPFARAGSALDVTVSSVGTASSLEGGTLMMTALRGPDGQVYAMSQGKIYIESRTGKNAGGGSRSLLTVQIPQGAVIEKELQYNWADLKELRYQLNKPDFTTSARIAVRINEELSGRFAIPQDAGAVQVVVPYGYEGTPVDLIAQIESMDVEADQAAKVIVNPRTGTVVLGDAVRLLPAAVAHGNLSVEIKDPRPPASEGADAAAEEPAAAQKPKNRVMMVRGSTSISELVSGLNEMGATADDLMAVLKALKASGALIADLEVQ
ncbi:flagellar basal body P-ring protein FlgI [bacterium]|nr:flagellar basal body P-ring protein FlgI [bacterium]